MYIYIYVYIYICTYISFSKVLCDTIVGVLQTFPFKHTLIDVYHINTYQMYLSPITLWRIISILILFVLSTGENRVLAYSLWGI